MLLNGSSPASLLNVPRLLSGKCEPWLPALYYVLLQVLRFLSDYD